MSYNNILKLYEDLNKEKDNKKQEPLPEVKNWLAKKAVEKNEANKLLLARVDRIKNEIDKISSSDSLQSKLLKLWFKEKDGYRRFESVNNKAQDLIKLSKCNSGLKSDYLASLINYHTKFSDLYEESNNKSKSLDALPKIAIVGQYSCGKSQFINSLLGEEIQQTGPNPVTHAVTEFSYGETTQISDINGNEYTKSDYKAIDDKTINKIKEFYVTYKLDLLKHVKIFDTPGWDPASGTATSNDEQLTKKAIEKSDIVFYLMDINDGTIVDDTLNRLKEIQKSDKKLYVILTRVDKCFDFEADEAENNPVKLNIMESLKLDKDKVMFYSSDNESREEQYVEDTKGKIGRIILNAEKSKNNIALNKDKANENEKSFVNEYCSFIAKDVLGDAFQYMDKIISKGNLYNESYFTCLENKTNELIVLFNY